MTTIAGGRRHAVSVEELKRAWDAIQAGRFRHPADDHSAPSTLRGTPQAPAWEPAPGEAVLPVVGCVGSCGATTVALALATASESRARVIECASATTSGLPAASTAELGPDLSGRWLRGTRGEVLLERAAGALAAVGDVPVPSESECPVEVTVLDIGWELAHVMAAGSWLSGQVTRAATVMLVTTATVPGLRRLEAALDVLAGTPVLAAVVGPARRRWDRAVEHGAGPLTRALDHAGHLTAVPRDRALAVAGLTPQPLPAPLLAAASHLLRLAAAGIATKGTHPE